MERERDIAEQDTEIDQVEKGDSSESSALRSDRDSNDVSEEMEDKLIYADVTEQLIDKTRVDN